MIADAAEVSEIPAPVETPPWKSDKPAAEIKAQEPAPVAAAIIDDTFHNDPLIQAALIKFEGKVLS
jgi:hypothetical protein